MKIPEHLSHNAKNYVSGVMGLAQLEFSQTLKTAMWKSGLAILSFVFFVTSILWLTSSGVEILHPTLGQAQATGIMGLSCFLIAVLIAWRAKSMVLPVDPAPVAKQALVEQIKSAELGIADASKDIQILARHEIQKMNPLHSIVQKNPRTIVLGALALGIFLGANRSSRP